MTSEARRRVGQALDIMCVCVCVCLYVYVVCAAEREEKSCRRSDLGSSLVPLGLVGCSGKNRRRVRCHAREMNNAGQGWVALGSAEQ